MTAKELHQQLIDRGYSLTAKDDKLFVVPREGLTPEECEVIKELKLEILEIVRGCKPSLRDDFSVHIPFCSEPKYQWWRSGQSLYVTLAELSAPLETWRLYSQPREDLLTPAHAVRCKGNVENREQFAYCVECGFYAEWDSARWQQQARAKGAA